MYNTVFFCGMLDGEMYFKFGAIIEESTFASSRKFTAFIFTGGGVSA